MNNTKQPPMPKTATMPMPAKLVPQSGPGPDAYGQRGHNSFLAPLHDEAGRVVQNIIDMQTEIAVLRKERMEWERRALLAEGKVEQMKQEFADAKDDYNRDVELLKGSNIENVARVTRELDYFKGRDAVVQTKLAIGAQHFIDCITAIDKDKKEQETKVLAGMHDELSKAIDDANLALPEVETK
jgi:hypothetical protein